jgi:KDO2-lipid IV(A) lauroyltransferase
MYYLLLAILYPLSLLPLQLLYALSDIIFFIAYYIAGYRKEMVLESLQRAFPGKNAGELNQIRHRFYRNFYDQWMETLKLLSISEKELNRRITGNWEIFHQLHTENKNAYVLLGHTFNWEWASVACQYNVQQQFAGVYMPIDNEAFDKLIKKVRSRSGVRLISMKAKKGMQRLKEVRHIVGLIADQNPSNLQHVEWHSFLNREAPFFTGPEKLARREKAAVVFAGITKVRRGYYEVRLEKIADDASLMDTGGIMHAYVSFMEQQIKEQPENWMWTHRRWKHKRD